MGQAVELAEGDHLSATVGQRANGGAEDFEFVGMVDDLGDTGPILYHGQMFEFS